MELNCDFYNEVINLVDDLIFYPFQEIFVFIMLSDDDFLQGEYDAYCKYCGFAGFKPLSSYKGFCFKSSLGESICEPTIFIPSVMSSSPIIIFNKVVF